MAIQTLEEMLEEAKKKKKKQQDKPVTTALQSKIPTFKDLTGEDIAPVKETKKTTAGKVAQSDVMYQKNKDRFDGWFKKSQGNTSQAVKGTLADAILQPLTGALGSGEQVVDFLAPFSSAMWMSQQMQGGRMLTPEDLKKADQIKKDSQKFIKKDLYNEEEIAKKILTGIGTGVALGQTSTAGITTAEDYKRAEQTKKDIKKYFDEDMGRYSVLDEKTHGLLQSAGQLGVTAGLSAVGVPWWLTTGATSFGGEMENALNQGATMEQAMGSSLISAGTEVLTEKLSGGISFGGKTLDDGLTNILARSISNKGLRALSKIGMDFVGEGSEEIISQFFSRLGSSLYKEDNLKEILFSEEAFDEYLTSFISGGVLGGTSSGISVGKSAAKGTDVLTGYTANEQKVFDKVVKDLVEERGGDKLTSRQKSKIYDEVAQALEEGSIDIETIERTLGEDFTGYDSLIEESKEFEKLFKTPSGELSREQQKRLEELEAKVEGTTYEKMIAETRQNISKSAFSKLGKDSRLQESYFEESKRGQDYEADLTKYDEKQRETIQRAMDSGILNNTKKTHKLVDLIAKVSAEKGVSFDFTNNQKLKESGFAIDGKTVNGFKNGNNITINMQSKKALNTVVGHEITHVLEGSDLYNALADSVKSFVDSKGIYRSIYDTAIENYKNVYTDMTEEQYADAVAKEVTADLVGEYIFSDVDFVRKLSTDNRNVFEKIFDEIKYFCKQVTVGSDAEKQLLKAKKIFEDVYRENTENNTKLQYDIAEDKSLYQYIKDALDGKLPKKSFHKLSDKISERLATDIEKIVGFSVKEYSNEISPSSIEHINKDHGRNGKSDKSMSNLHDLAKVNYVINNYDAIREGKESKLYKNKDGSHARTVELQKKIDDGFYYVVEAVPDAKTRALHVISAYINKKNTFSEVAVSKDPSRYVQDELQSNVFNNIITQNSENTIESGKDSESGAEHHVPYSVSGGEHTAQTDYKGIYAKDILKTDVFGTNETANSVPEAMGDIAPVADVPTQEESAEELPQTPEEKLYSLEEEQKTKLEEMEKTVDSIEEEDSPELSVEEQYSARVENYRSAIEGFNNAKAGIEKAFDEVIAQKSAELSSRNENFEAAIKGLQESKNTLSRSFDEQIVRKEAEYKALKKKDTKKAGNLLIQIENIKLRKANALAEIDTKINSKTNARNTATKKSAELMLQIENLNLRKKNNLANIDTRIERTQARLDKMIAEEVSVKDGMYGKRRKEAHEGIVKNIKSYFVSKGLDLDEVLNKAKNLSTFSTVDNTPQRVMEKALGYKEGQALADMTVNKVALNESEGIRWVNGIVKELKQISKEYGIKPRSKESAAAQKLAEGYYVDENDRVLPYGEEQLKAEFPNARRREDIRRLASDPRIRKIYDDALDMINASRRKSNYKEIPKRQNYFLHTMEKSDIFSRLGTPFNPQDIGSADLPTDINGMTVDFTPGQPYFASANARKGFKTTYDLLGGVEKYVNSAKNQIFHIEDIQTLRALRNYIADMFGQAKGFEGLDEMSDVEVAKRIKDIKSNHLSSFAKFLNEEANIIAGKTPLLDRALEGTAGRRGIKVIDTINKQVGSNMVGFNVSSALTNVVSGVQAMAKSNKFDVLKAFTQTVSNRIGSMYGKTDGFTEENSGYIRRQGIERFSSRPVDKVRDAGYFLMGAVDNVTSEFILRTKYNELTRKGMSSEQAHIEADKWTHRILGDRTIGQQPQLYNSKMLGLITKFQLEVRNQLDSQFYDTFQEAKATSDNNMKIAAKVGKTMFELAVLQHVFGKAFESVTGYNPAFDLIEVLMTVIGADDDEESEDTTLDNIEQGFLALLDDLPYTSVLTGGRIPIESALPVKELITGENDYGQEKSRIETLKEIAPYYVLPTGYGQIKKTIQGLGMFDDDLPVSGSYTDSGNLRFPVEDTLENRVKAGLFGQYANENARDYFDNGRDSLKEKQIQEYKELDLPIREYWDYREGLKKQETLEDKFEYVAGMDVSVEQKNIMINNIVDRKEKVDMSNYDEFAGYEEFDWYSKNTEKYNFLKENGVSYAEYKEDEDTKKQYDSDYSVYQKNPEKVAVSKAVAGSFLEYRNYLRDLEEFRADKDSKGNSISGSAKAKKMAHIESLPLDAGQKMILHRSLFDSKSDKNAYNGAIIEYLDSRNDISQEEYILILEELDMKVHSDGRITW